MTVFLKICLAIMILLSIWVITLFGKNVIQTGVHVDDDTEHPIFNYISKEKLQQIIKWGLIILYCIKIVILIIIGITL